MPGSIWLELVIEIRFRDPPPPPLPSTPSHLNQQEGQTSRTYNARGDGGKAKLGGGVPHSLSLGIGGAPVPTGAMGLAGLPPLGGRPGLLFWLLASPLPCARLPVGAIVCSRQESEEW